MKLFSSIGLTIASVLLASVWACGPGAVTAWAGEVSVCGDPDFNNDGEVDGDDLADFDRVSGGGDPCRRGSPEEPVEPVCCDSIDFNGNGVYPEDADRDAFLIVLAGGPCPLDGWTPIRQTGPTVRVQPGESIAAVYQRLQWSGGIVEIPWSSRPGGVYEEAIKWPDQESLPYGNVAFVGIAGPDGQRPVINVPRGGAGARPNASNIRISGLHFVARDAPFGIDVQGDVTNILIEDCIIEGGAIGIQVAGNTTPSSMVRVRRNIVHGHRSPNSHSQGMYVSTAHTLLVEENLFFDNGTPGSDKNQTMYLVHNALCQRNIENNWIVVMTGSAGIQARGGTYTIIGNVVALANTGIGGGHPMAYDAVRPERTVWTAGIFARNVIADTRADAPAQWGACYMLGKPIEWRENVIVGVARPWMSSVDQGGGAAAVPIGDVRKSGNVVKMERSGFDWLGKVQELKARKSGEWDSASWDTQAVRVKLAA